MRNSRRGDYGGNFRRRNERNRLLFTTRIETVLFRMIKNQYVFLSRNVLSTFRLFLNKVNTNGRNHDSKYSNRSHRASRAELLIKKKINVLSLFILQQNNRTNVLEKERNFREIDYEPFLFT